MGYDPSGEKTFSINLNFLAFLLGGVSSSVSLSFDTYENMAIQTSEANVFKKNSGGIFGTASIGAGLSFCRPN